MLPARLSSWVHGATNYTPEYRETSGVGRRRLMTMDEVLRMDVDRALIIIRGKNVLEVDKYDYSKHPESKKMRSSKAAAHVPAWQKREGGQSKTPSTLPRPPPLLLAAPDSKGKVPDHRQNRKVVAASKNS